MTIHSALIQKLIRTNAHLGRRTAEHHFKKYTYGFRNGMTIIDSDKTLVCLRSACNFIGNLARENARFLFVNTNPLVDEIVEQMIKSIGCRNDNSWRQSGFLTNSMSPKLFRSRNKKFNLTQVKPPDCLVLFDTERKSSVIHEATKLQIPIVGLVDPSMPLETFEKITYPIPANDSVQFVYLFCNLITKTIKYEQQKLAAAKGKVLVREEEATKTREAAQPVDKIKLDGIKDELLAVPYKRLCPASDDPTEIKDLLDKLVVLKVNDNERTNMGFDGPKCAIEIANGLTSLDLLANYIESLNSKYGCNVPLLLMNDDSTHNETLKIVERHSNKKIVCLVKDQNQGDDAKIAFDQKDTLLTLKKIGKLDDLLLQGKEFILLLNSDNLAEVVDTNILNHLIKNKIKYCMELEESFRDSTTLNRWVNINSVANNPSTKLFKPPIAVAVPASRSLPLEETSDLLIFKSDLYTCNGGILERNEARSNPVNPIIELGPEFEKVADFESRFKSIPSIIDLDKLNVSGDVWFGYGIILKGSVSINARPGDKIVIPDWTVLENMSINGQQDI